MAYIYITESEAKYFFLNKYLRKKRFEFGKQPKRGYCSFKIVEGEQPTREESSEVLFLSQFNHAKIPSERDIVILNRNYDVPTGFLELGKSDPDIKITDIDSPQESTCDDVFLAFRNGFLNSFNKSRAEKKTFEYWIQKLNSLNSTSIILLKRIIVEILEAGGFPQVQVTVETAKSTKVELQFIFFGRLLAQIYFADNEGKTDEEHRNWLLNLNPKKDMIIGQIPQRFLEDSSIIVAYLLNLKLSAEQTEFSLKNCMEFISSLSGFTDSGLSLEEILFYAHFIQGVYNTELTRIFHTNSSQKILSSIEKKAFSLTKEKECQVFEEVSPEMISNIWKICSEKITPKSQIFTDYSLMVAGEKAKERTEEEILQKIQPFNLSQKEIMMFFFKDERSLENLRSFLLGVHSIKKVLLVYKLTKASKETLQKDFSTNAIRSYFEKLFLSIEFEIIVKVMSDNDDREVKNNIKGFLNKHFKDTNLLFWSDVTGNETRRENLWIATAFSKTPVFAIDEDYFFIS